MRAELTLHQGSKYLLLQADTRKEQKLLDELSESVPFNKLSYVTPSHVHYVTHEPKNCFVELRFLTQKQWREKLKALNK